MKTFWVDESEDMLTIEGEAAATFVAPEGSTLLLVRGMTLHSDIPIVRVRRASAFNQDVKAALPKSHVLAEYVPYLLLGHKPALREKVDAAGHGTGRLALDALQAIPVHLPRSTEQACIANLLSALDEKIELNRRMAGTLEAMARALFKSWFVDFDPVRAKAEGRPTNLPVNLECLFPNRFEDELPGGWSMQATGDLLSNVVLRARPSSEIAAMPYVPIDSILTRKLSDVVARPGEEAQSSLVKFKQDDILFGAMRPYFHKVCLAPADGTTRTTVFVLRPKSTDDLAFCLLMMSEDSTVDYASSSASGSTIPYAVWDGTLANMHFPVPPPALRKTFADLALPMIRRAQAAAKQSRTLAALRDTLLPKLISGELRIEDAATEVSVA